MAPPLLAPPSALRFALLITLIGALGCIWNAWCEFPIHAWNEARLAPAFALRHGINPYPPLGGGPLSTWIYGPVGILINLPATFADTPKGALHLASLVNLLVVLLPLAVIFFSSPTLRDRGAAMPWQALTLGILLVPRPNLVLQVADHAAIALGLLSCWSLVREPQPGRRRLIVAAVLCALAVWAKQIAIFLIPAQLAYLLLLRARAAAGQFLAWVTLFGLAIFGLAGWAFGFGNLWLNLVEIPGRLPWADITDRLAMRPAALLAQVALPILGLIWLWRRRLWPSRLGECGRFFQLTVLAYIAMLPVGLAAFLKIGGDTNLLHSWDYLLAGGLLAWLAFDRPTPAAPARLLAAALLAVTLHWTDLTSLPSRPFTGHLTAAAQLTAAYPHAIWFPRNPVITFYADHKLWHSEDGIQTRFLAGYGLRQPDFRRHLPADLQAVAYPANVEFPFVMPLLAELNQKIRIPYWNVHVRSPEPPAKQPSESSAPVPARGN